MMFCSYRCIKSRDHLFVYDNSVFMLNFIDYFSYELGFFYELCDTDNLWHHSFNQFLRDHNEICTGYVKLEIRHFVCENLLIFWIFIEKIVIYCENYVYCTVQLPCTFPPPSLWTPIRVGSVRDTSFTNLRILFQHKKQKNNCFYLNWLIVRIFLIFDNNSINNKATILCLHS